MKGLKLFTGFSTFIIAFVQIILFMMLIVYPKNNQLIIAFVICTTLGFVTAFLFLTLYDKE